VRPRLLQVNGVADVVSYGGLVEEIHVEPDPARMASLGVGLADVFEALQEVERQRERRLRRARRESFVIRSLGIFTDVDDIGKVRVAYHDGRPVELKDVARSASATRRGRAS
jgi:cobalt-zinc-cadmium resistance protein CzcA